MPTGNESKQRSLQRALQQHQAGNLPQAEALYREILAADPRQAEALHLLGILAKQAGHPAAAIELITQALQIRPHFPEALGNLGVALAEMNRADEAIACYRKAIALNPDYPEAHSNLGNALRHRGQVDEAIFHFRRAVAVRPNFPEAHNNLGDALKHKGRLQEAIASFRNAVSLQPAYAHAHANLGNALLDAGNVDGAIASYRMAISLKPDYAQCHSNLGNAFCAKGDAEAAMACFRKAIALKSDLHEAHNNLGNLLSGKKQLDEAVDHYRKAIAIKPDYPQAYNNLGSGLRELGKLDEAIAACNSAISLQPQYPEAHNNLGNALKDKGQVEASIACFRKAIEIKPNNGDAYSNLGNALKEVGRLDEAIAAHRQSVVINPTSAEALSNLGNCLRDRGNLNEALDCCRKAIALKPELPEAHNNLGNLLKDMNQLDEAVGCYRTAIALKPDYAEAYSNLGNFYKDAGQMDEAVASYRRAVQLNPRLAQADSNLVYSLHFHPDYDAQSLYQEHVRWNQQHAEPLREFIRPHSNDRDPDRRLRIGYVSPDFRRHPVGRFLLPLLENHDHSQVDIFCYASQHWRDDLTERLASHADTWRTVAGLSDAELARQIREDRIDILIDLTLHMASNRLLVFARKPAPVQVSWLGYPGTTGLRTIDYRITDPHMDPPGVNDAFYSEESIRLPDIAACYRPVDETPQVNPLPVLSAGHVTFGCLNNFCKVNHDTLATWAAVLNAVAGSHLLLYAQEGAHRQRAQQRLAAEGIDPGRVSFVGFGGGKYFEFYHRMDLALDPFPYGGGTTTCESLWMGVPVITLAGTAAFSRMGLATLECVGLPEFVTHSQEAYVRKAAEWANDLPRLAEMRSGLREKMQASPLMDAPRFARNMESAYRAMWRRWCSPSGGPQTC